MFSFSDILATMSLSAGVVLMDIHRLRPTGSHTIPSLLSQYASHKLFYTIGSLIHLSFNRQSRDCGRYQEVLLKQIIQQNKNTSCGHKFKIESVKTVEDYQKTVPLTTYNDYKELAEEVQTIDSENIFFPGKSDYLAFSSGTTSGKSKVFPKSVSSFMRKLGPFGFLQQKCLLQVPSNNWLRKWLALRHYPVFFYSESGIKCGPVYGMAVEKSINCYVTPKTCRRTTKEDHTIYINLVFGLLEEKICNLFFPTAGVALAFFRTLEKSWEAICYDIENGTISNGADIPTELIKNCQKHLNGGNPKRAESLRHEFRKGFDAIVPRVWDTCPALFCISSGSFETQVITQG